MSEGGLSAEEAKLYDRGIRLWGVEAQQRLRESVVLVLGMTEAAAELCKNVVLAGISKLVVAFADDLMDSTLKHGSNMFVLAEDAEGGNNAEKRAQLALSRINELNNYVRVEALHLASWDPSIVASALSSSVLAQYDFVCVCDNAVPLKTAEELNERTRDAGASFLDLRLFGTQAFLFCDMPLFDPEAASRSAAASSEEHLPSKRRCPRQRCCVKHGPSYSQVLSLSDEDLRVLGAPFLFYVIRALESDPEHAKEQLKQSGESEESVAAMLELYKGQSEAAYMCAVIGGVASQEVVKELMRDHRPPEELVASVSATSLSTDEQRRRQQARKQQQNATGQPLCNVLCLDCVTGVSKVFFAAKEEAQRVRAAQQTAVDDVTEIL